MVLFSIESFELALLTLFVIYDFYMNGSCLLILYRKFGNRLKKQPPTQRCLPKASFVCVIDGEITQNGKFHSRYFLVKQDEHKDWANLQIWALKLP